VRGDRFSAIGSGSKKEKGMAKAKAEGDGGRAGVRCQGENECVEA
jgi:hypothetical protein